MSLNDTVVIEGEVNLLNVIDGDPAVVLANIPIADGSITEAKLSDSLKLKTINEYVTPEMYGAKGDGVTDDTDALQSCITSGNYVLLKGTYLITAALNFNNVSNLVFDGGKITRNADQTFNTINGSNCNNIHICNVEFDGNGNDLNQSYQWRDNAQACIILASQSKNIFIEKCKIKNHHYGIFILGADVESAPTNFANTSLNGVIRDCTFSNCNSGIDTYGKGILIDNNTFYGITGAAIQIEPNLTPNDATIDNPINDTNYYCSALGVSITNNTLIDITNYAIQVFPNSYSVSIYHNTIVDYGAGIGCSTGIKNLNISDNCLLCQKAQTVSSGVNVWSYTYKGISVVGNVTCKGNYIWKADIGIYSQGGANIVDNIIDSPRISAIVHYDISSWANKKSFIENNKVLNHIKNVNAIWSARAIVIGESKKVMLINNVVESDVQPLYVRSGNMAYVSGLLSDTAQQDAITPISGINSYTNV